jgi:prepilin-type N-terminal cleavage/methylation domain-containing protein
MTHERSTQSVPISPHRRGFTMAEMMVAITIMVIVTAIVASLFVQVRKMIGLTQWGSETRAQLRTVVGTLAQDLENIDPQAYFLMLNRDYGWDSNQVPALPADARGPVLYPDDDPTSNANRSFWADRIAFIANGPFNSLQGLGSVSAGSPYIGASARVYYGQSLWTHELTDMWWASQGTGVSAVLNPFQPQPGPADRGPYQMAAWPGDITRRPAVGWNLLRQAVLHVNDSDADHDPGSQLAMNLGLTREIDWRAAIDHEFTMVDSTLGLYTPDAVARQIDAWLGATVPSQDWMALLWSPRVDSAPISTAPAQNPDPTVMARARVLLPHAARLRFQVRLSDGTVIPQLDETNDNPRLRGQLVSPGVYPLSPDYTLPNPQPLPGTPWSFVLADPRPTGTPNSVHLGNQPTYQVPAKQVAYIWTPSSTNVQPAAGTTMLYPVAIRIRIEVYDPQRRTPDPIKLDEWLPVRWR